MKCANEIGTHFQFCDQLITMMNSVSNLYTLKPDRISRFLASFGSENHQRQLELISWLENQIRQEHEELREKMEEVHELKSIVKYLTDENESLKIELQLQRDD